MALPNTPYAPQTSPLMSSLDGTFAAVAALGIIPCTATGSNNITLTPSANTPTVTGYANYQQFSFVAVGTSSGPVQVQVGALNFLNLYTGGSAVNQAGSGNVVTNVLYVIAYNSALAANAGGFVIVSASPVSPAQPQAAVFQSTGVLSFSTSSGSSVSTIYKITATGGGGSGAGGVSASASGGGSGSTIIAWASGIAPNTAIAITVGSGGGFQGNNTSGNGGGTTTVITGGLTITAPGGTGGGIGSSFTVGSAGGTANVPVFITLVGAVVSDNIPSGGPSIWGGWDAPGSGGPHVSNNNGQSGQSGLVLLEWQQ